MMSLRTATLSILMLCVGSTVVAQSEPTDLSVAYKIKQEGAKNSDVERLIYRLTDAVGPRLTGSDRMEAGYKAAKAIMEEYGFSNVQQEFARDWHRGGWDITKAYVAMTLPYYTHIYALPVGWSGGTNGLVKSDVVLLEATSHEKLQEYAGKLKGKIVLIASPYQYRVSDAAPQVVRRTSAELAQEETNYPLTAFGSYRKNRARPPFGYLDIAEFLTREGAVAMINESGDFNVPKTTHYDHNQNSKPTLCQLNITSEVHSMMERMIRAGEPVSMEVEVAVKFTKDRKIYNILGEIPGTDPLLKDQIVLLGAHLDSHHGGTGATDDAAGCVAMLEALRILKETGVQPRRTIRVALWGGEEMGIHGSSGYIEQHVADFKTKTPKELYDKISVYFNSDYGPGKFRGIYTQDNLMVNPIFRTWMEPYKDMGFESVQNRSVGSTDHMPFDDIGIPGFQFIHDHLEWGRGAHQAMDHADRLVPADLKHNAVVVAWFAYCAAQRDEMMPRKAIKEWYTKPYIYEVK